jgi:phosphoribosylformylglycinamidine cyclo-ligase
MAQSYTDAGVNLEAGYDVVRRIRRRTAGMARLGMMGGIGDFGGMFDLSALGMQEPVLVSGTDGVGTKLKLAFALNKHDSVGIDLVAMCVNDVVTSGAEPLFFLDYIAMSRSDPDKIEQIIAGIVDGCQQAGCALLGGETAEMPDMYASGEYDLAGFAVGAVEKRRIIGKKTAAGDVLIGIASSGVHSNGFSLVRKIISDANLDINKKYSELNKNLTLGEILLAPTKIYVKPILETIRQCSVHGICHITGGGFDENIPRMLLPNQGAAIKEDSWNILTIFNFLEKHGKIPHREMFNIFNMGIGMAIALPACEADAAISLLERHGEQAYVIGEVTNKTGVFLV